MWARPLGRTNLELPVACKEYAMSKRALLTSVGILAMFCYWTLSANGQLGNCPNPGTKKNSKCVGQLAANCTTPKNCVQMGNDILLVDAKNIIPVGNCGPLASGDPIQDCIVCTPLTCAVGSIYTSQPRCILNIGPLAWSVSFNACR